MLRNGMAKINGRFYFKRTRNGNLIGEFSNDAGTDVFSESADLITQDTGGYLGTYRSTWREKSTAFFAELTISPQGRLFRLEWHDGVIKFKGEGMLCDDILVGDYQSAI
jgi:hypothetical protein